jgi:heat-inducible transcriptional repressor
MPKCTLMYSKNDMSELTDREELVLGHIIQQYVLSASPVGSRTISKQMSAALSAASIRNVMADLEEKGFINHPHTSAGRIPTDTGYRYYVDEMAASVPLTDEENQLIDTLFEEKGGSGLDEMIKESSKLLGKISHQLAIVSAPQIGSGRLRHLDLVQVASNRILVIISIMSGLVKTIVLEIHSEVAKSTLEKMEVFLNERLAGLTLREIRESFHERMKDADDESGLIRVFMQSSPTLFSDYLDPDNLHIEGVTGMLAQPEFGDPERLKRVVEIIENQKVIIHILNEIDDASPMTIKIGSEIIDQKLQDYSLITAPYQYGPLVGTLGIFGPRRMNYPRMIAIVEQVAKLLCQ